MTGQVSWMLEMEIQEGREQDFRDLMALMVSAAQANEPGTLDYEWSTSEDGRRCHSFERYADSAAAVRHLATFGEKFAGPFLEILKPVRFVVYGSPDAAVRDALAAFGPVYMHPAGGFSR